jgi:hypothetical protein
MNAYLDLGLVHVVREVGDHYLVTRGRRARVGRRRSSHPCTRSGTRRCLAEDLLAGGTTTSAAGRAATATSGLGLGGNDLWTESGAVSLDTVDGLTSSRAMSILARYRRGDKRLVGGGRGERSTRGEVTRGRCAFLCCVEGRLLPGLTRFLASPSGSRVLDRAQLS